MSNMKYVDNEQGSAATAVTISLLVLALLGALGFAGWAFMGRQDYKTNVDKYVEQAVKKNTAEVKLTDSALFAEEAKKPNKLYTGPVEFGGVNILYPKTWSTYAVINSGAPLSVYFHPDVVPSVQAQTSSFALRVEVVNVKYSQILLQYSNFQRQGTAKAAPFALPKVPTVIGTKIDGQITQNKKGSIVVIPIRDKTLKIWTESESFLKDFNETILPNASFSP